MDFQIENKKKKYPSIQKEYIQDTRCEKKIKKKKKVRKRYFHDAQKIRRKFLLGRLSGVSIFFVARLFLASIGTISFKRGVSSLLAAPSLRENRARKCF